MVDQSPHVALVSKRQERDDAHHGLQHAGVGPLRAGHRHDGIYAKNEGRRNGTKRFGSRNGSHRNGAKRFGAELRATSGKIRQGKDGAVGVGVGLSRGADTRGGGGGSYQTNARLVKGGTGSAKIANK